MDSFAIPTRHMVGRPISANLIDDKSIGPRLDSPGGSYVGDGMSEGSGQDAHSEPILQLRSEALDWLVVDAEIVALDGRQDLYLGLNQSGAELWRALANGTTRTQLVELLVETFDIDRETASRDTDAFLAALTDRDLLLEI